MKTLEWCVDNYTEQVSGTKVITSPTYQVFGHDFSITFMPDGRNETPDYCSVYLKWNYSDTSSEPADLLSQDPRNLAEPADLLSQDPRNLAEPLIRFTIQLTDGIGSFHGSQRGLHRFTKENFDWGWTKFYWAGLKQNLLKNTDRLIIRVFCSDNVSDSIEPFEANNIKLKGLSLGTDVSEPADTTVRIKDVDFSLHSHILAEAGLNINIINSDISAQVFSDIIAFIYQSFIDVTNDSLYHLAIGAHALGIDIAAKIVLDVYNVITFLNAAIHTGDYSLKRKCIDYIIPQAHGIYDCRILGSHIKLASLIEIINEIASQYMSHGKPLAWTEYFQYVLAFVIDWLMMRDFATYIKVLVSSTKINVILAACDLVDNLRYRYRDDPRCDAMIGCYRKLKELTAKK